MTERLFLEAKCLPAVPQTFVLDNNNHEITLKIIMNKCLTIYIEEH